MHNEMSMLIVKKKRRICIPKNLNIIHSWHIIGPIVAQEIGASDYTPIPYCFDTNAYKIGHIFVPIGTQVTDYNIIMTFILSYPIFYITHETENVFLLCSGSENTRTDS